jgi:hypothetical protein
VNGFHGVELPFCGDLAAMLTDPVEATMTARWSPEDEDDWYDNGGTLNPAFSGLAGPEPVLPAEQVARGLDHIAKNYGRPEFDEGDQ